MSQVYSVSLIRLQYKDREGAKNALQQRIAKGAEERVNYSLDHYRDDIGLDLENVDDLVRMIFGGWEARLEPGSIPGWLTAGFNASYGWESVMMDAFEAMGPFLEETAEVYIDVDEGYDRGRVINGKVEWIH